MSFSMFGVGIGIRVNRDEFLSPLLSYLPIECEPNSPTPIERLYSLVKVDAPSLRENHSNILYGGSRELARSTNLTNICGAFESDLEFYVGQATREYVFVHAGVVGWNGRAIIIPGRSHSGKTTLVRALLQEGATYYSDEFAVLDGEGRVHPFPRPLSIRTAFSSERVAALELGARTGIRSLPVGLVVLTRYKAGGCWKPKLLSLGQGMLGILQNTLSARLHPELTFNTLGKSVSQARVLRGPRGEACETAKLILMHMEQKSV